MRFSAGGNLYRLREKMAFILPKEIINTSF